MFDRFGKIVCVACRSPMRMSLLETSLRGTAEYTFKCQGCPHTRLIEVGLIVHRAAITDAARP